MHGLPFIFVVEGSGQRGELPFDPLAHYGFMGLRQVTPQQKPERSTQGSWTGTLFKAALIGTALAGAAYAGYRQGFFDGANGMFDTLKDHFQNQAGPSGAEIGTGASAVATATGEAHLANPVNFDEMRAHFASEAARRNPLMNVASLNVNTTALGETAAHYWEAAKAAMPNPVDAYEGLKNDLFWGAVTTAGTVSTVLLSVAKCMGSIPGFRR